MKFQKGKLYKVIFTNPRQPGADRLSMATKYDRDSVAVNKGTVLLYLSGKLNYWDDCGTMKPSYRLHKFLLGDKVLFYTERETVENPVQPKLPAGYFLKDMFELVVEDHDQT